MNDRMWELFHGEQRRKERIKRQSSTNGELPQTYKEDVQEWHKRRCIPMTGDWNADGKRAGFVFRKGLWKPRYNLRGKANICIDCKEYGCSWIQDYGEVSGWNAEPSTMYQGGWSIKGCPLYRE